MKVLLTGSSGYVGRSLMKRFLAEPGIELRLLVRDSRRLEHTPGGDVEILEGDLLSRELLLRATGGIDVAYFPPGFFWSGGKFDSLLRSFSERFVEACIESGVKRLVILEDAAVGGEEGSYRGAAAHIDSFLSDHAGTIQTVRVKAGAIVGAGSLLFEVVENLVVGTPILIVPRWMLEKIPAIGLDDLVGILFRAKDATCGGDCTVEIRSEELNLREMLGIAARVLERKKFFLPVPFSLPRVSSFFLSLVTPLSFGLSLFIVRSLASGVMTHQRFTAGSADDLLSAVRPEPFEYAFRRGVEAGGGESSGGRWLDSLIDVSAGGDETQFAVYRKTVRRSFGAIPAEAVFRQVRLIGGRRGWFSFDALWRVRGIMDKLGGGFGMSLGRRSQSELRVGDVVDVWKVLDIRGNERLLLESILKPGRGWLEFRIEGNMLTVNAFFDPQGPAGILYWYFLLPVHILIWRNMARSIIEMAG